MIYKEIKWKTTGLFKADPNLVYEELQTLEEITPEAIVEMARNENSVLHNEIDWDDEVAAEKWRKQQARIILCNLVVEVVDKENEKPTQIRLLHKPDECKHYETVEAILRNKSEYDSLLETAKRELNSYKVKYHILKELKPVFEAIDEL